MSAAPRGAPRFPGDPAFPFCPPAPPLPDVLASATLPLPAVPVLPPWLADPPDPVVGLDVPLAPPAGNEFPDPPVPLPPEPCLVPPSLKAPGSSASPSAQPAKVAAEVVHIARTKIEK